MGGSCVQTLPQTLAREGGRHPPRWVQGRECAGRGAVAPPSFLKYPFPVQSYLFLSHVSLGSHSLSSVTVMGSPGVTGAGLQVVLVTRRGGGCSVCEWDLPPRGASVGRTPRGQTAGRVREGSFLCTQGRGLPTRGRFSLKSYLQSKGLWGAWSCPGVGTQGREKTNSTKCQLGPGCKLWGGRAVPVLDSD